MRQLLSLAFICSLFFCTARAQEQSDYYLREDIPLPEGGKSGIKLWHPEGWYTLNEIPR